MPSQTHHTISYNSKPRYFMDCVEAPLTDHKKATNVFLLLAAERGFFDQVGWRALEIKKK